MTNGTKKTAAVIAGAVVLASAGYAIGSQAEDGTADAARAAAAPAAADSARLGRGPGPGPGGERPGLADLASRLGVSEERLAAAFEQVREDAAPRGERGERRAAALAEALGRPVAEVEQALERLHTAKADAFAATVAKELGVDAAKVKAAFEDARPEEGERRGGRRAMLSGVAQELGVSTAKLRSALRAARPERGDRDDHRAELARALGVSAEQLDAAQEKVRDAHEAEHEARRTELAAALAKNLGLSAAKVEEELGEAGPRAGHNPHGPGPR